MPFKCAACEILDKISTSTFSVVSIFPSPVEYYKERIHKPGMRFKGYTNRKYGFKKLFQGNDAVPALFTGAIHGVTGALSKAGSVRAVGRAKRDADAYGDL